MATISESARQISGRLFELSRRFATPGWKPVTESGRENELKIFLAGVLPFYQTDRDVRQYLYASGLTFYQPDRQLPKWMDLLSYIDTLAIIGPRPKKITNKKDPHNDPAITVTLSSDGPYHQVVISAHPPQTIFPPSVAISPLNPDLPQIQIRLINDLSILNAPTKGVSLREPEKSQPESIFAPRTAQLCTQEVVNQAIGLIPPEERNGITQFWTVHSVLMLIDPNIKQSLLKIYGHKFRLPSSILIPTELTHKPPQLPPLR